jgi:mevalonate pyrophosphate decarboxylase
MELKAKYNFYEVEFVFTLNIPDKETSLCNLTVDATRADYHSHREIKLPTVESVLYEEWVKAKQWAAEHKNKTSPIDILHQKLIDWGFKHS